MTASTVRNTALFAIATMLSRVSGLLRDSLFAGYFGTTSQYDSYLVAIMLPFFLRKIFADGAMTMAFVPIFNEKLGESRQKAYGFASAIIVFVLVVSGIVSAGGVLFSSDLSSVFAGGFDTQALALTGQLIKISFPFITLVSLWAVYCGILNSLDAFFIAAVSPMFINISTIIGILLSSRLETPIIGPTIGFVAGGLIQLLVVMFTARRAGFKFSPSFSKSDAREFLTLFMVSAISPAINEINSFVDIRVSTELGEGAVASLGYAQRLYQLPLGMFAIAVATVALPQLSKLSRRESKGDFKKALWDALFVLSFLLIPSTLGLLVLGENFVRLLFERGAFTPADTMITSRLLLAYTIGLPFYGAYGVLSRAYYARKRAVTPTVISATMVGVNIVLDITLGLTIGTVGVALATTIAGIVGTTIVSMALFRYTGLDRASLISITKILIASSIMAGLMYIGRSIGGTGILSTAVNVVLGISVYFALAKLMKFGRGISFRRLLGLTRRRGAH